MRSIAKLFSQALLLLAPMLTLGFSFLDRLGYKADASGDVTVNLFYLFPLSGKKDSVEFSLRVLASLAGFATIVAYEFFDYIIPRRDLGEFRSAYLKQQKTEWRDNLENQIPKDVRINIMHVRHPWYTLFIGRFYWTWNDGFHPPNQKDSKLLLLTLQGVAGIAYRAQEAKWIDLRGFPPPKVRFGDYGKYVGLGIGLAFSVLIPLWGLIPSKYIVVGMVFIGVITMLRVLSLHPFYLWPRQARKTEYVKYILSIPIFKASKGDNVTYKRAGVINLDTTSDAGAAFLEANRGRLVDHFYEAGLVLACLG